MNRTRKILFGSLASLAVVGVVSGAAAAAGPASVSDALTAKAPQGEVGSPQSMSQGFLLHNNSAQRLNFQYVTGKVPAPPAGQVQPGGEVDYEIPANFLTEHASGDVLYQIVAPDGSQGYTLDLHLDAINPDKTTVTVKDSNGNKVSNYLSASVGSSDDKVDVTLNDTTAAWAGSKVTITPGQNGWSQDEVAAALKVAGPNSGNCVFENITTDPTAQSAPVVLVSQYEAAGTGHVGTQSTLGTSVTDSWENEISGEVEALGVTAGVTHSVGHSVTQSHDFSTNSTVDIDAGYTGVIYGKYPVIRATGDFKFKLGATTLEFDGASFDYPDATRPMAYTGTEIAGDHTSDPEYQVDPHVSGPRVVGAKSIPVKRIEK